MPAKFMTEWNNHNGKEIYFQNMQLMKMLFISQILCVITLNLCIQTNGIAVIAWVIYAGDIIFEFEVIEIPALLYFEDCNFRAI